MRRLLAPLALLLALAGCDTADQQRSFREAAFLPPSGFTRTDANGTVISADPDDWRTSPLYGPAATTWVSVEPVRPNPVDVTGTAELLVRVRTGAVVGGLTVLGLIEVEGQTPRSVILADLLDARTGAYALQITPAASPVFAQSGVLRRLVVVDGQGEPVSYGDLRIE